jgi:superoxide dismutase, Fe-Mn family
MKPYFLILILIIMTYSNNTNAQHIQKELNYEFNALEPHIDAKTMEVHFTKHHAGYIAKLNKAIEGTEYSDYDLIKLQKNINKETPASIRNNGGGSWNHEFFWELLTPEKGMEPSEKLNEAIIRDFGSFDNFKSEFKNAALGQFGSGWAWLIVQDGKLKVSSTPNQDNPLMKVAKEKGTPILAIDVWEHAYYLKYQNLRGDYIEAFFNVVNWDKVSKNFEKAIK